MNDFRIEFTSAALRELKVIDAGALSPIGATISNLAIDIRPVGSRRLRTRRGYRIDVEDIRIIYTIDVNALHIVIVSVRRHVAIPREEFSTQLI
ncbi:MAG TPA: type II toxin-antitoxin system RelE/ParE family toxin [Acidimicrobiales bacterium]|nr:type II toxin-antitoxin system RelE/ParE family toxin [Acidimicrobiales bacterium]